MSKTELARACSLITTGPISRLFGGQLTKWTAGLRERVWAETVQRGPWIGCRAADQGKAREGGRQDIFTNVGFA
jgi:hypothetical protein